MTERELLSTILDETRETRADVRNALERIALVQQASAQQRLEIDDHEDRLRKQERAPAIEVAVAQHAQNCRVSLDHETRLRAVEHQQASWTGRWGVIGAMIAALVSLAIAVAGKLWKP